MQSSELLKAVAVTAELCGRVFTEQAAAVFVDDLAGLPEHAVLAALRRCRREVRGVLTVHDVISRVDDGRPGPDEAWALLPMSENLSAVWTEEMASAFGVALPLLEDGQGTAARFAFREAYMKRVAESRDAGKPVNWSVSLGSDLRHRQQVVMHAIQLGRLPRDARDLYLPAPEPADPKVRALIDSVHLKLIGG